jgi:hypothetical protein
MENITLGFMIMFVALGLLMVGLAVPMIRGWVKPNLWYGFRTAKTLSNEEIWYKANAYSGQWMLVIGLILAAASVVLYLIPSIRVDLVTYNIIILIVTMVGLVVMVYQSFRYLQTL